MHRMFFRIVDSLDQVPRRWHLGIPVDRLGQEVDSRDFTAGCAVSVDSPLTIPVEERGTPLGITFASFEMPVVSSEVGELFSQFVSDSIQRVPARVEGQVQFYEILNVTKVIRCLDEDRSYVMKWTESDGRPEKVGQYRMIANLHIKEHDVGHADLFRIAGWEVALVCSQRIREALEKAGVTGVKFEEV